MKKDKIYQLHVEHYHWLENLRFYEDEINLSEEENKRANAKECALRGKGSI